MSNEIKLTVSLKEEDRARIDALTLALGGFCIKALPVKEAAEPLSEPVSAEPTEDKENIKEETKTQPDAPQAPEPTPESPATPAEPEPEAPAQQYTVADVQQKVVALSAAGKKVEVREIVTAYAERVSAIPADKLDEVMSKLIALEG